MAETEELRSSSSPTGILFPKIEENKHTNIDSIAELKEFPLDVVDRFIKKFGGFMKPDSITKSERKRLKVLTKFKLNNKDRREKEQMKKNRNRRLRPDKKMCESKNKLRIAFDLSYFDESCMRFVDMRKCLKQIQRCYSENRKFPEPVQFHITSVSGKAEESLANISGYKNWDVQFHSTSVMEVFKREDIVYLTSDSENIIDSLDDTKVYVIGGLLDHNSLKGLSYSKAIANNVSHGRLPIDKYLNMKTLKVLPVSQVFSIVASVSNGASWSDALLSNIPQRKDATPKLN